MSAIAVFCGSDSVVIASDGICYDQSGIVLGLTSKVLMVPELHCVIGNVGIGGFAVALRQRMGATYRNFDHLLDGIVGDVRVVHDYFLREYPFVPHATVVLAGWSDARQAFETYRIGTRPKKILGEDGSITVPAFSLVALPESWVSAALCKENYERFGLDQSGEETDVVDYAARCICACRASGHPVGEGDFEGLPYQVGGFIQITIIDRKGMTSSIVHRWPDAIGKPVDKTSGDAMPAFPLSCPV